MTSSKGSFSGIWGETTPEMREVAEELSEENIEKHVRIKRLTFRNAFGVISVFSTMFLFFIISLAVTAIYGFATGETNPLNLAKDPIYIVLSMVSMHASWLLGSWIAVKAPSIKRYFWRIKFRFKKYDILIGLGYAAVFFAISTGLSWFLTDVLGLDITAAENTSIFTQFTGIWLFVFAYLFVSILGPTVEELFFRGFIMQAFVNSISRILNPRKFRWAIQILALIITSSAFGFMHLQMDAGSVWWVTVAITGMLGLFMGGISILHNRLGPAVFAHIFYNCTAITIAILSLR